MYRVLTNVFSACNRTKEVMIQIFRYIYDFGIVKKKEKVASIKILLDDDELYTEKTFQSECIHPGK